MKTVVENFSLYSSLFIRYRFYVKLIHGRFDLPPPPVATTLQYSNWNSIFYHVIRELDLQRDFRCGLLASAFYDCGLLFSFINVENQSLVFIVHELNIIVTNQPYYVFSIA